MKVVKLNEVWRFAVGTDASIETIAQALVDAGMNGATIYEAKGMWKGAVEASKVIEIAGLGHKDSFKLAEKLRERFEQEAVYVEHAGEAWLVFKGEEEEEQRDGRLYSDV